MSFPFPNRVLARCLAALLAAAAAAASEGHAQVTVDGAWARAAVPNQSATGAFMRLTARKDVVLTGASSPVAGIVEVHEMSMDKGIMRMRAADRVPLKAGQTIELRQPHLRGGAQEPLTSAEIEDKFLCNARYGGWPEARAKEALALVRTIYDGKIDLSRLRD